MGIAHILGFVNLRLSNSVHFDDIIMSLHAYRLGKIQVYAVLLTSICKPAFEAHRTLTLLTLRFKLTIILDCRCPSKIPLAPIVR